MKPKVDLKPRVIVERIDEYGKVRKFVEKVFEDFSLESDGEIIVKPNFLKYDDPSNGCITHPEVVKATVEVAKAHGLKPLIAEGGFKKDSSDRCFKAFKLSGVAECVNLNRDEFVNIHVGGKALKEVSVSKTALKALKNSFISLPKLKVHHLTRVTLGIKNNMGFLKKPAVYMHFNIHQKLVDLLKLFNPSLVIIDGVIGGNLSESKTKPLKHGVMIASNNVIAADAIAAQLMGFNPEEIKHLKLAAEEFKINMTKIDVNENIDDLKVKYDLSLVSRVLGSLGI